jgi:cytochrome c biogenesis protein CcmG/thiol:disulfide interchange protein DsbE
MRAFLKLLLLLVVAVVAVEFWLGSREPAGAPAAAQGAPAPPLALATLEGRRVDLRALRGRVVAVNFWATWCAPCQKELPDLASFVRERKGQCLDVLAVASWSGRDDVGKTAGTLPYPVLFDADGEAVDAWKVNAVPRTYVVDPQGRIRAEFRGVVARGDLAAAVDPLLPATCPAPPG